MSNATIQQVIRSLQKLPESEQGVVLDFLGALRCKRAATRASARRRRRNLAVKSIGNSLVFTGKIGDSAIDWVELAREERHQHILHPPTGQTARR